MRIDRYTKTLLTLIVLLLAVIALKPVVQPTPVKADSPFADITFSGGPGGFWMFSARTGDIWNYNMQGGPPMHMKLGAPGQPLQR